MTIPAIDSVQLPATGTLQGKNLTVKVACELMKNHLPALPVSPTSDIRVVQDATGKPLLLSIGSDLHFHLLHFDASSATGWSAIDLTASLPGYARAVAFDVRQDSFGNISLAVAHAKAGATATDLFVASMLPSDVSKAGWANFGALATKVAGIDADFAASHVLIGSSDQKAGLDDQADKTPGALVVATGALNGQQYYYQFAADGANAAKLEFPENLGAKAAVLLGVAPGYAFGQPGFYFLYNNGASQTLECTTLPGADMGVMHYDYSVGNANLPPACNNLRYNCLTTTTGSKADAFSICSDIYVGTDGGVYVFPNATTGLQKITDQIGDVHEIMVSAHGSDLAVWALCSPNNLYYIAGKRTGAACSWSQPVLFSSNAIHLAPMRSSANGANELFLVNQDQTVTHFWQDPNSTLWQQRVINVKGGNFLFDVHSFTSQIHLEDDTGMPLAGQAVRVTSSEWSYVTANGHLYSLDADNAATIACDNQGNVTIIALANDIASPIYHVESDVFASTLNIYPNGRIQQGLQTIRSGDDLLNAKTADGKPVAPSVAPEQAAGVAGSISQMSDAGSKLVDGDRATGAIYLTVSAAGQKHTGHLLCASLPPKLAVSMVMQNGAWQHQPLAAVAAPLGSAADFLADAAGDVLHFLESLADQALQAIKDSVIVLADGATFALKIVEAGLSLVLTVAGKVFTVILKTMACVFKALNSVLRLIGIDLTKILAWLGHLFGWDDIWDAHKAIAAVINNGLSYAAERMSTDIDHWRTAATSAFDGFEQQVRDFVLPADVAAISAVGAGDKSRAGQPAGQMQQPQTNFTSYHLQHGAMLAGGGAGLGVGVTFQQFIDNVAEPTLSSMLDQLGKVAKDVLELLRDPSKTFDQLRLMLVDIVGLVLEPLRKLVDGSLGLMQELIVEMRDELSATADIPFLSSFYEFVTTLLGEEEDFTFVNALSLMIAIPVVELGKAALGHSPLRNTDTLQDPATLRAVTGGAVAAPAPQQGRMLAATAPSPADNQTVPDKVMKSYVSAGKVLGPIASLVADQTAFLAYGGASHPNTFDKASAVASLALVAVSFPADKTGLARDMRIMSWMLLLVNTVVWWKLPTDKLKGSVQAITNMADLVMLMIADGAGKEHGDTFAADILVCGGNVGVGALSALGSETEEFKLFAMAAIYFGDIVAFGFGLNDDISG